MGRARIFLASKVFNNQSRVVLPFQRVALGLFFGAGHLALLPEQGFDLCSVILPYVRIRPIKKLLVLMQLVLQQGLSERLLDLSLARARLLPVREANDANDLVD